MAPSRSTHWARFHAASRAAVFLALFVSAAQFCVCAGEAAASPREPEARLLGQLLANYDATVRPAGQNRSDGPVIVLVNTFVRSIDAISDVKMDFDVQLTLRQQWHDERLKFNDNGGKIKFLTLQDVSKVWTSDMFFSNEKNGYFHNILTPNAFIRIYPSGSVLYSVRISLTLACPMNLKQYPMDYQECTIRMASYGWTTDDLVFVWKKGDPVQIVKNLNLPRFTLQQYRTDDCSSQTNTGKYSCLRADLYFRRELSPYLVQVYVPSAMLVLVSWVSFWIDHEAVTARIVLATTTLLATTLLLAGMRTTMPPVSYSTAMDVWTGTCFTFVFAALLEFTTVHYLSGLRQRAEPDQADGAVRCRNDRLKAWLSPLLGLAKRLDVVSRLTFPLAFLAFNANYWGYRLLRDADDQHGATTYYNGV